MTQQQSLTVPHTNPGPQVLMNGTAHCRGTATLGEHRWPCPGPLHSTHNYIFLSDARVQVVHGHLGAFQGAEDGLPQNRVAKVRVEPGKPPRARDTGPRSQWCPLWPHHLVPNMGVCLHPLSGPPLSRHVSHLHQGC